MILNKPNFLKQYDKRWANYTHWKYPQYKLKSKACGPTCVANVVSVLASLKQSKLTPKDVFIWAADQKGYYVGKAGFTYNSLKPMLEHYGVKSVTITYDGSVARKALKRGDWVIGAMVRCRWGRGGHFVLAYAITDNDHVLVSDPSNNTDYRQKDGKWFEFMGGCKYYAIINNVKSYGLTTASNTNPAGDPTTATNVNLDNVDFSMFGGAISVDYTKLGTYLMQLNRKSTNVDWKKLKNNQIIGALIEAGYLYKKSGQQVNLFDSPKSLEQVRGALSASKPFGYYTYGRAKNSEQARLEMYWLSFIVKKYPPRLGVWIILDLQGSKSQNDKILKIYQQELVELGLKNKIGIYCNRAYLKKFSWEKFQDDWALWLDDVVKDKSSLDALLTPEFFDTDGKG